MAESSRLVKRVIVVLMVAFLVILAGLVVAALSVPDIKSFPAYVDREPINIQGDSDLNAGNGVTSGSGTASDPYVIEGWQIGSTSSHGIVIADTPAHVVVRNTTIAMSLIYYSSTVRYDYDGLVLQNASNVLVDRVSITGAWNGILVRDCNPLDQLSIRITRCTVLKCLNNIHLVNSSNCMVDNNVIRDAGSPCVFLEGCTSIIISNNEVTYSDPARYADLTLTTGISILGSADILLIDNDILGTYTQGDCTHISTSHGVEISRNGIASYSMWTLCVNISQSTDVDVNNNSFLGAIYVKESDGCDLAYNGFGAEDSVRVSLDSSSHIRVYRNNIDRSFGIVGRSVTDSEIVENIVSNCSGNGISVEGTNITISRNLVEFNEQGVYVGGANITVDGNIIVSATAAPYGGEGGIWAFNAVDLVITNNSIIVYPVPYVTPYAIWLQGGSGVTIENCGITGDIWCGSVTYLNMSENRIDGDGRIVLNSHYFRVDEIVHNSMYNISVYDPSGTGVVEWDQGYPLGGNYWSQYAGIDEKSGAGQNQPGADGIGDSPYAITAGHTDQYPLMTPITRYDTTPPVTALDVSGLVGYRNWYRSEVNFTLTSFDNIAGVESLRYRLDSGSWTDYTSQVTLSGEGDHQLEFYAVDLAGNVEDVRTILIKIDSEAPQYVKNQSVTYRFKDTDLATFVYEFQDNTSGVLSYLMTSSAYGYWGYEFDTIPTEEVWLADGTHTYRAAAKDGAGNIANIDIELVVSLNEIRDPRSADGPYGIWFQVVIYIDLALLASAILLAYAMVIEPRQPDDPKGPQSRPASEIDKEEVVDGYPKFMWKRA